MQRQKSAQRVIFIVVQSDNPDALHQPDKGRSGQDNCVCSPVNFVCQYARPFNQVFKVYFNQQLMQHLFR